MHLQPHAAEAAGCYTIVAWEVGRRLAGHRSLRKRNTAMLQGPTQSFSARGNSFLRRASYPGAPCTKTTPRLLSVPKACDQNSGRAEAIASGLMKLIHVRL